MCTHEARRAHEPRDAFPAAPHPEHSQLRMDAGRAVGASTARVDGLNLLLQCGVSLGPR